jgi:maltodextrin utilization protein YvdJ
MTRGKSNPFRVYTFWECQKIAYWASLAPAILAMILSFSLPAYAMIYYIFFYGMRIMWMSMRSLRPQYDESK